MNRRLELADHQRDLRAALRVTLRDMDLSSDIRPALADLGLYAMEAPAAVGGLELGLANGVVVCEELGRHARDGDYQSIALLSELLGPDSDPAHADLFKGRYRVLLAAEGDVRISDTARISGRCPAPGHTEDVDIIVAPARTSSGVRTFVAVETGSPGVTVDPGPVLRLAGAVAPSGGQFARAWTRQAAYLLGLAAGAHKLAVRRAATRRQFDRPLIHNQAIAFPLARDHINLEALRLLVHRAAWRLDRGEDGTLDATRSLAYAAELALEVTARAVHVHGAFGLTANAPVQRHYRLAAIEAVRWGNPADLWRLAAAVGV